LSIFKNQYYLLRHGQSQANAKEIIISDLKNGITQYGLTETGKNQTLNAFVKNHTFNQETIIYSSPFLRTKETAQIVKKVLNCKKIIIDDRLKERFFGVFEKTSNKNYQKVWKKDKLNENNNENNVESPKQVWNRMKPLLNKLEKKYSNKKIILISHGDPLQILITGFNNKSLNLHRKIKHLNVAEIRRLN
jgi:probable phosphoglycerate mutase